MKIVNRISVVTVISTRRTSVYNTHGTEQETPKGEERKVPSNTTSPSEFQGFQEGKVTYVTVRLRQGVLVGVSVFQGPEDKIDNILSGL